MKLKEEPNQLLLATIISLPFIAVLFMIKCIIDSLKNKNN